MKGNTELLTGLNSPLQNELTAINPYMLTGMKSNARRLNKCVRRIDWTIKSKVFQSDYSTKMRDKL